jgi:hypothetical protein
MVAADFLRDTQVRQWLDGVEPACTLRTFDSLRALPQEPSAVQTAIRIANDLSADEVAASAVARNALLRQTTERVVSVTATGNARTSRARPPLPRARADLHWNLGDHGERGRRRCSRGCGSKRCIAPVRGDDSCGRGYRRIVGASDRPLAHSGEARRSSFNCGRRRYSAVARR